MSTSRSKQSANLVSDQGELEYSLQYVAQHNAEQDKYVYMVDPPSAALGLPSYQAPEHANVEAGPSTYDDPYKDIREEEYQYSDMSMQTGSTNHTPSTPYSIAGRSTRSKRATPRTDSPISPGTTGPAAKAKGKKRARKELPSEYQLKVPFSLLEVNWGNIPLKAVHQRAQWSQSERKSQATKKDGRIARPMNCFMLYRAAWADRCKHYFKISNHQLVSAICAYSWNLEPKEVQSQWRMLSKQESDNHKAHLPGYRYQPSKPLGKREHEDSENEGYGVDGDPDGDYVPSGRQTKQAKRQQPHPIEYLSTTPYASDPYNAPVQTEGNAQGSQMIPYNQWQPYFGQDGHYLSAQNQWQTGIGEARMVNSTPVSTYSASDGLVGLPGGPHLDMAYQSRTHTPMSQYQQQARPEDSFHNQNAIAYREHELQASTDPGFGMNIGHESHFTEAMGGYGNVIHQDWTAEIDPLLNDGFPSEYPFGMNQ